MELPKKQLPWSLPRYYKPVGTFSCENSPFLGGTRGIVLLSSRVWKDVNGWALKMGISCTYSNPVVTGGRKHTHTIPLQAGYLHLIWQLQYQRMYQCVNHRILHQNDFYKLFVPAGQIAVLIRSNNQVLQQAPYNFLTCELTCSCLFCLCPHTST